MKEATLLDKVNVLKRFWFKLKPVMNKLNSAVNRHLLLNHFKYIQYVLA